MTAEPDERPVILDVETEREVLFQRLCARVERGLRITLQPGLTVADGSVAMAGTAATEVLAALRVLSARQLAVLLAQEANSGRHHVIHEPPRYTAEETEDAR